MNSPNSEAAFEVTHQELMTIEEYEAQLRSEARETAAKSVRRIQLEGARNMARLEHKYARELEVAARAARTTTRRMTSGLSIGFLVLAASLIGSIVDVPELTQDVAFQPEKQYEVAGFHVAVSGAEAESELAVEPDPSEAPKPLLRPFRSAPRVTARPKPAATVDPCTGDPYDPLNFCL